MPSIPANLDWLFYAIGGVLALGSIWMLVWALFRDRARAKFRCPKCWYDLTGPEGAAPALPVTCSECGRIIAKPKHLRKTRAKWRYAFLAVALFLASGAIAYYPSVRRNGWLSILPTRFLIDSMPVFGYPSPLTDELVRRCSAQFVTGAPRASHAPQLTIADRVYVLNRITDGMSSAPLLSERWKRTLGAFVRDKRVVLGNVFDPNGRLHQDPALEAAKDRFYKLPPQFSMRTRPTWPREYPLWIELTCIEWWLSPGTMSTKIYDPRTNERLAMAEAGFTVSQTGLEPQGVFAFVVDVEWGGDWNRAPQEREHAEIHLAVPYRIAGSVSDILTPVIDPAIDQLVASMTYSSGWRARLEMGSTCTPRTRGIGFGVLIEHSLDGVLQTVERAWWIGDLQPKSYGWEPYDHEFVFDDPRLGPAGDRRHPGSAQPGEDWTVRIYSDPETALRVIDADKYWQGDVTIPLTIR